ncbi:hypothetical protein D3C71_1249590 [compost metagenome]
MTLTLSSVVALGDGVAVVACCAKAPAGSRAADSAMAMAADNESRLCVRALCFIPLSWIEYMADAET